MVHVRPINAITWEDIETFCDQKIEEGAHLDYKKDFPANLENTIAAMANTFGGIVVIGVAEDAENRPMLPIAGIKFEKGLSERVTNIILMNITPPLFPEIAVCRNTAGDRALVLIRIAQSDQTPHAIASNTRVYIRTGNRNKPEEIATIERIEWLQGNRRKSVNLREQVCVRAAQRALGYFESFRETASQGGKQLKYEQGGWLTLSICPMYPDREFCTPPELKPIHEQIKVQDYFPVQVDYAGPEFPQPDVVGTIAQDAMLFHAADEYGSCYTELNTFGLYFYKQSLMRLLVTQPGKPWAILVHEVFCRLDQFLESAEKYFSSLGYWGLLLFRMRLDCLRGCGLVQYPVPRFPALRFCPDPEIESSQVFLAAKLRGERFPIICAFAKRIAWAFDIELTEEKLAACYEEYKKA